MLITMEKDIIWMFDVVSGDCAGLHAHLAGKISTDEGDELYHACEEAQTLLVIEGLTTSVWKSLSALRSTLLAVVETKLGRGHRLCCRLRYSETDQELAGQLESLRELQGAGSEVARTTPDRLLIDLFANGLTCIQDLHPRLFGLAAHQLV